MNIENDSREIGRCTKPPLWAFVVVVILLLSLCLLVSGCAGLNGYDRTYSVIYENAEGTRLETGMTLRPRAGKTMRPPRQ